MRQGLLIAAALLMGCATTQNDTLTTEPAETPNMAEVQRTATPAPTAVDPPAPDNTAEAPTAAAPAAPAEPEAPAQFDWAPWGELLAAHVTEDGGFRYAALKADEAASAKLDQIVTAIGETDPSEYPRDVKLAFYINAYNALTVKGVVDRFPITSVMRVEGFFDAITHKVAGEDITLNHLENELIRAQFQEPRIHFAVNCASAGCPPLRNEVFDPARLEAQLEEQSVAFVRSSTQTRGRTIKTSQIFEWFADDFGGADGAKEFVRTRLEGEAAELAAQSNTRWRHFEYDWDVNARD